MILIVEDDIYIRESLQELLETEGFKVTTVDNGQSAIDWLRRARTLPQLILLDLMMPIKDGFAFRQEQLADKHLAGVPVVIMTADSNIEAKSRQIGVKEFLKKPLDLDALLACAQRYCTI